MEEENHGRGSTAMNESDLAYLRNINTQPGTNAGRSIDPTKPGPDADRRALAQSDAEPVAWRWRYKGTNIWRYIDDPRSAEHKRDYHDKFDVEPLYTAPPHPDTSAGLIEAADADLIHDLADELGLAEWASPAEAETILRKLITKYHRRLNAADRSEK